MVAPVRHVLLALFLLVPQLAAAVPVGRVRHVPAGRSEAPIAAASGGHTLVIWNRGDGAVRFDADSVPLDVPAIALPKPAFTAGADLVATEGGWTVGWTIFDLGELASSQLQLVDVDRDGAVSGLRAYALPEVVPQGAETHLAVRGDVIVVAYRSEGHVAVAAIDGRGRVTASTFEGTLAELASTPSGFALVLGDRVLLLPESGVGSLASIALPAGFLASDIEADGNDLLLAGTIGDAVAVVRIRDGAAAVVASVPGSGSFVRFARNGPELLLVWKRGISTFSNASWDLMAARVVLGGVTGQPVLLRPAIDASGRWVCCPDPPAVVALGAGWTVLWSEGYRSPGITWRNLFAARVAAGSSSIDQPRLLTFAAASQVLVGTAQREDVVLVVWQESNDILGSPTTYATRYTTGGRRLDAEDLVLGAIQPQRVRVTPDGFAVLGTSAIVSIDANGGIRSNAAPSPMTDLSCTDSMCLAAWRETNGGEPPAAIRVSRWRDGVLLDAPGIPVHFSDTLYNELAVANDGERFVVVFARPAAPGGSILSVARVEPTDGQLRYATSNMAASTASIHSLQLVFEGNGYLTTWRADVQRASRLTREGHSTDGEETGWEGWPLAVDESIRELVHDGERTLVLASDYVRQNVYVLVERTPVAISAEESRQASLACIAPGNCILTSLRTVRGWPWYEADRLFLSGVTSRRRVARP
jgi:hypothetical protein